MTELLGTIQWSDFGLLFRVLLFVWASICGVAVSVFLVAMMVAIVKGVQNANINRRNRYDT